MHCAKKEKIQSDLAKAKGLGSAHHGTEHWMAQRITALSNIPLVIWFIYSVMSLKGASHAEFTAYMAEPYNAFAAILLVMSVFYHAVLGAQVVVEDYISCKCFKMMKLIGMKLFFTALAVACIFSILKIAL